MEIPCSCHEIMTMFHTQQWNDTFLIHSLYKPFHSREVVEYLQSQDSKASRPRYCLSVWSWRHVSHLTQDCSLKTDCVCVCTVAYVLERHNLAPEIRVKWPVFCMRWCEWNAVCFWQWKRTFVFASPLSQNPIALAPSTGDKTNSTEFPCRCTSKEEKHSLSL